MIALSTGSNLAGVKLSGRAQDPNGAQAAMLAEVRRLLDGVSVAG